MRAKGSLPIMPRNSVLGIDLERGEATIAIVVDLPSTPTSTVARSVEDGELDTYAVPQSLSTNLSDDKGESHIEYCFPYVPPETLGLKIPSNGFAPWSSPTDMVEYYSITAVDDLGGDGFRYSINHINVDNLPELELKKRRYSAREVVETLNYGNAPLFSQLIPFLDMRPDIKRLYSIWDASLLHDISLSLSSDSWNSQLAVWSILSSQENGTDFESRISSAHVRIPLKIIRTCLHFFNQGRTVPHSYIVTAISRFVEYLRKNLAKDFVAPGDFSSPSVVNFCVKFEDFWRTIAGTKTITLVINVS